MSVIQRYLMHEDGVKISFCNVIFYLLYDTNYIQILYSIWIQLPTVIRKLLLWW